MKSVLLLCCLLLCHTLHGAGPTQIRDWEAKTGHKVKASATGVANGKVVLKRENGKTLGVELDKFIDSDQELLRKHFSIPDESSPLAGSGAKAAEGLPYALGRIEGPVDAGGGSSYHIYLPKSLKQGRPAPLVFFCAPWGGKNPGFIRGITECADRFGWVVALSVDSSNAHNDATNTRHCKSSLEHLLGSLPVDKKRIHYAGHSGGAAQSFINTTIMPAYGIMPSGGYIPGGLGPKAEVIYGICGGFDFNRHTTAKAVARFKKDGIHRISRNGHARSPDSFREDGIFWMSCRYLGEEKDSHPEEIKDFEHAALTWLMELKQDQPGRAYSNAVFFRDDYQPEGHNGRALELLIKELEESPDNALYHEALLALDEFSEKCLASGAFPDSSVMGQVSAEVAKKADQLKEAYGGLDEINEVLEALKKKTDSLKK
ncbi:MAG: SHD1 domain-containing protein [Verrucomicrobiota bacterium JB025]|nr:SHD1 domain-containing protein [Verrucomicrobiota bacterium JB025]